MTVEPIDPATFRKVASLWLSGVAVITGRAHDGAPVGLTMSAVTPLSLEPPLYLICLANESATLAAIRETGLFCINVLSEAQEAVCRTFASKRTDKFDAVAVEGDADGPPELAGSLARVQCRVASATQAGDHVVVIGEVLRLTAAGGGPLGYFRGRSGPVHQDLVASEILERQDTA
jgi:3-hydroxy-9,10-secoandrosta-1,3,5(10)-triene-9,17-dione monooxygenase reductase component